MVSGVAQIPKGAVGESSLRCDVPDGESSPKDRR